MNQDTEAMVRLIYRHYAALLDGPVATDPQVMLQELGKSSPWWGVKEFKNDKPVFNRLGGGIILIVDQDVLTVILSPGHVLPGKDKKDKRAYIPKGRPAPSVRRMVMVASKNGVITHGNHKTPEAEVLAYLAELGIPAAPSTSDIKADLIAGRYPIKPPFLFSELSNSLPKSAMYFAPSTINTLCIGSGTGCQTRSMGRIRLSFTAYTQMNPDDRAEVRALLENKLAMTLPPTVMSWLRQLPGLPDDRRTLFDLIEGEASGWQDQEANHDQP